MRRHPILELVHENQDRRRVRTGPQVETPEAVFTVMMPWTKPAYVIRGPRISYPSDLIGKGLMGFLTLTFVVDTAGRVELKTVRDIWPSDRPRLVGEMGRYYDAFAAAVRRGLPNARFEPARVGGCPVKIWVQQSFDFRPR